MISTSSSKVPHTIQGRDRIKVDLGVEQRLKRGGYVVRVIVLIMTVTMSVTAMVMVVARHDE
jgi:hypothetical protein